MAAVCATWLFFRKAAPKSAIFTSVPEAIMMFAGLMSRCTMPSLAAYSSAPQHLKAICSTSATGSSLSGRVCADRSPPVTSSMAMWPESSLTTASRMATMCGWRILPASEASCTNCER